MFSKFFKKDKSRVFLGSLGVAPKDFLPSGDEWGLLKDEDLTAGLIESLTSTICLPNLSTRNAPLDSDLALDLAVLKHQGGQFFNFNAPQIVLPIFWRPTVEVAGRLYNIKTGVVVTSASSHEKLPWKQFVARLFTLNGLFRYKPLFGKVDMEILLCKASIKVLRQLRKKL